MAADLEGERPTDVDHEAVARPGSTTLLDTAAGVDEGGQVGVEEHEARHLPGHPHAGQVLQDIGVPVEVDTTNDRDVPDRPQPELCVGQLAEAQCWIPLPVDVLVVETVMTAIIEDVDKEEAVPQLPAQRILHGEDGGVLPSARERVRELAILILEFGLCGRRGQHQPRAHCASQQTLGVPAAP